MAGDIIRTRRDGSPGFLIGPNEPDSWCYFHHVKNSCAGERT